ncbi:probable ATP-dependent RNA helicase DDX20 isoform X1 [Empidonax traillii]|uniref:probable ATP-dependent RNA helicase DDX20 isoform X1 n=1 Tax=Empidonax traillii TaxID=164674 RepID=UPI000FFD1A6F|nr:probable ATP-dependent RNA helicase DDX20 isoform X1 [Empidonax traillii]
MAAPTEPPPPPQGRFRTRDVLVPGGPSDFGSLLLSPPVLAGLEAAGFLRPSPVQLKAIPLGRCGLDLIVQAKSGTGKTCVFATIALDAVLLESPATQILVLAPTREIAVQIHAVITTIAIKMEGLECHVFIGGTPLSQDKSRLKKCHIAVGSPGRIKQLIELDYLNTASIRLFILDEADKLLEEGSFQEQINWIYSSLPANKQMLAVSATYPESLAHALTRYMREPTFVRLNPTDPSLLGLKQYYKIVNSHPLPHKTFEEKTQHLQELFSKIPFNQALVFSNLHSRAQHLAEILTSRGFPAECISGNMNQNQRLDAMAKLKQFHCRVLISTDLTSRGIDAEKVNLVVNLDVPVDWETYMHRIGRAGRFGTLGLSVTYCCRGEEENTMMKIAQKCNLQLLPLPEPIPPGMMDQFEDGEVEVKPAVLPGPLVNCDTVSKPEDPVLQPAQNGFPEAPQPLSNLPGDNSSAERPKKSQKQKQIKKSTNPANKNRRTPQTSSCPTEQRNPVKTVSRADGRHNTQAPDEEALKKNLPKIPCLSSFKNQLNNPWSFSDFVEDYEYFIKEGSERQVEILRSYSGPAEQRELPRNGDVEWEEMGHHTETAANGDISGDSDGSDTSRDSFSSGEDNSCFETFSRTTSNGRENNSCFEAFSRASSNSRENNSCFEVYSDPQEKNAVPKRHQGRSGFCPTPEKPQEPSQVPKEKEGKKKVLKQNAKKKKSHNQQFSSSSTRKNEEDWTCSSWDDAPSEAWSYEDYWKCYHEAWQSYYAAVSHYRESYRQFSWMRAYHVNSVYLQELLKSGD